MSLNACLGGFLGLALLMVAATSAQQSEPAAPPNGGRIDLDVVVTPKSGPPVGDLQQQDFTVLDNKVPRPIASFRAVNGRNAPVEIVLVIDAVNANYTSVSYQRAQIEKFLRADEGRIARPIALAIFTDQGSRIVGNFSTDGNALSAELDREDVALRSVERSTGFWGATERWQISLQAMTQLITTVASDPGRKIVICISPGWPLLSGPRVQLEFENAAPDLRGRRESVDSNAAGPRHALQCRSIWAGRVYDSDVLLRGVSEGDQPSPVRRCPAISGCRSWPSRAAALPLRLATTSWATYSNASAMSRPTTRFRSIRRRRRRRTSTISWKLKSRRVD